MSLPAPILPAGDRSQWRVVIAQWCGWRQHPSANGANWQSPSGRIDPAPPDYLNDLNAIHEAEKLLTGAQCLKYVEELNRATKCFEHITPAIMIFATASQRSESLLRTIGKL